jgi:hypothetical protein
MITAKDFSSAANAPTRNAPVARPAPAPLDPKPATDEKAEIARLREAL